MARIGGVSAGIGFALVLAACASTKRSPTGGAIGEGGEDGATSPQTSAGTGAGGSFIGSAGSRAEGGSVTGAAGSVAEGGANAVSECIEGALCLCGDATGTLACDGALALEDGQCVCPPVSACQAPRGSCFEPCGGDALGLWVLEETCFPGTEIGGCEGGSIEGTSALHDVKVIVLENEPVRVTGSESLDVRAQVPLQCLGIESVHRCKDADFYAAPLFFGVSRPLDCEPSACGFCQCSGDVYGGTGSGAPWTPGSSTLAFGSIDVAYCVDGDTMWAGGGEVVGEPKVAYKFRRRSCVGTPLPCAERESGQCGTGDDCRPGRCLPDGGDASVCAELPYEEYCSSEPGCQWLAGGCWGTASDSCGADHCEGTPGCSWGAPQARCGGERASCYMLDPSVCHAPGCSMRTCDVPDGWSGIDGAPCERLTPAACSNAPGCSVNGATCIGTTLCAAQTDAAVCAMLECALYEEPTCGGYTTTPCAELSVEDCRFQPGCRLEW